jgi:hypothetical protein
VSPCNDAMTSRAARFRGGQRETDTDWVSEPRPSEPKWVVELPAAQRLLLEAHDRFMREAYEFVTSARGVLTSIGRILVYVLFVRLLQHARGLHLLVLAGYSEEAELIARAMTATALSLITIVDDESDGRALQFVRHGRHLRRKKLDGYIREEIIPADRANAWDAKVTAREEEVLADYAEHGVIPAPLGDGKTFWHGLPETELFKRMNAQRWLDLFYVPFSEEVHGATTTVADTLRKLKKDRLVRVGPTFSDPRMVIAASYETIVQALFQIDTFYDLDRRADVDTINSRMTAALRVYAEQVRGDGVISAMLEEADIEDLGEA